MTATFMGFTLPMVTMDAHIGINGGSLLLWGTVCAGAVLMIYAAVLYFFNGAMHKKRAYSLPEKEAATYWHNHGLKGRCAAVLAAAIAVTFVAHQAATSIWGTWTIMKGTTFEDYDSFIQYMGQDIPADGPTVYYETGGTEVAQAPEGQSTVYHDKYGNEISREEALTRRLEDKNGKMVCEYIELNERVVSIRYTPKDGTVLPITVFTQDDLAAARNTASVRYLGRRIVLRWLRQWWSISEREQGKGGDTRHT